MLRRQVPCRSISQIIHILEWEKITQPGRIKRSTLQEKLQLHSAIGYMAPYEYEQKLHREKKQKTA